MIKIFRSNYKTTSAVNDEEDDEPADPADNEDLIGIERRSRRSGGIPGPGMTRSYGQGPERKTQSSADGSADAVKSKGVENMGATLIYGADAIQEWDRLVGVLVGQGKSHSDAIGEVANVRPILHTEYLIQYNRQHGRHAVADNLERRHLADLERRGTRRIKVAS